MGVQTPRYMPPLVVYKAKHLYDTWCTDGPEGAYYAVTQSGWMSDTVFERWFCDSFIPFVAYLEKPVILLYDGHGSHLTYATVKAAIEALIIIVCLPPHTSHALQPLDVGVFKPLKDTCRRLLFNFFRQSRMKSIDKPKFPNLL